MADSVKKAGDSAADRLPNEQTVREYVNSLSNEHKMLVILKVQLYGGSWEPMLEDLSNRLEGKPYIFKLANRIKDDIARIKQMQEFEKKMGINLADYVDMAL